MVSAIARRSPKHRVRRFKQKRAPTLFVQENLQMGVTVTEVKDYLEFWLTRKTSDLQKEHKQQMASIKVPSPVLHKLEVAKLHNR